MVDFSKIEKDKILKILATVHDPEIPVLSIMEMGIVRKVEITDDEINIKIIPTYSGCPAMDTIADDIKTALKEHNLSANVELVLSPAWSTDFLTEKGKKALQEYGIATPMNEQLNKAALVNGEKIIECPQCGSTNTKVVSEFGSTASKALFKCEDCLEPFDYFKCLK